MALIRVRTKVRPLVRLLISQYVNLKERSLFPYLEGDYNYLKVRNVIRCISYFFPLTRGKLFDRSRKVLRIVNPNVLNKKHFETLAINDVY